MDTVRILFALSAAVLATACASPGATHGASQSPGMAPMAMGAGGSMPAMDERMKIMQAMHQKMMNASTPAERQALMAEHMKAMQGGMAMMKEMHAMHGAQGGQGGGSASGMGMMGAPGASTPMTGMGDGRGMSDDMAKRHQMMAEHMATMQMMMDMMADQMPPNSTGK